MTNKAAQKKQLPAFLILAIISLVAALALAVTNAITEGPIREHELKAQREAFGVVLEADEYNEITIPDGYNVTALVEAKKDGVTVGYCVVASSQGYNGPVAVTFGVDMDGKITGCKIGDTNFAETSGLGTRWLEEANMAQFVGIDVVEGGYVDSISGVTVTSKAVVNAANNALKAVNSVMGTTPVEPIIAFGVKEDKPVEQMTLTGDIKEGSAKGFASDVKVQLTLDENGAITGIVIDSSGETAGFGTRCMEEVSFAQQFVGKTAPLAIGEGIDALSGATVTSTAVVEAVNNAVSAPASADDAVVAEPTEEPFVPMTLTGDIKEGVAQGFQSEVKVQLTVDENGAITGLVIDSAGETAGFGTRCAEDADFINQFIGKTAPVTADALSGATVTSNAVVTAINAVLAPAPEATAEPVAEPTEAPVGNVVEGIAQGFQSEVKVTVTLDDNNVIIGLVIDSAGETAGFGTRCAEDEAFISQFIGQTAPVTADALSGATVTSTAVVNAVNSVFPTADMSVVDQTMPAADPVAEADAPAVLTATVSAFAGENVVVNVTLNEDGTVADLTVDASTQSPGLGKKCAEEGFVNQFIGQAGPFVLGENVDAVSYATITSQAVVDAVNSLLPAPAAAANEYTATVKGWKDGVIVTVTTGENGVITALTVDASGEFAELGGKCADEAFTSQFIGKTAPVEGVDAVAGATLTSNAVIDAVNTLLAK